MTHPHRPTDEARERQAADRAYDAAVAQAAAEYSQLISAAVSGFGTSMIEATRNLATAAQSAQDARQALLGPAQTFFEHQAKAAEDAARSILEPSQRAFVQAYADAKATFDLIAPEAQAVYNGRIAAAQATRTAALAK